MRILLIESSCYKPLNPYFAGALDELSQRYGWEFTFVDEADFFPIRLSLANRVCGKILGDHSWWRREQFNCHVRVTARTFKPDVLLIVNGKMIAPDTLRVIKRVTGALLVNYATDDPFNPVVTTRYFRESVPEFDIYATPKKALIQDLAAAGCKKALRTFFAYKPEVHFREKPATPSEKQRFECDVAFVGSCDPDRPRFFAGLLRSMPSLRLSIYGGGRWERYRFLRPYLHGEVSGRDFRLAVGGAGIALNFIRHANRDDHSERAFQLAACGTFILSERTDDQVKLLAEDREAAYFSSPEELAEKVGYYLDREAAREQIAVAGQERVLSGGHTCKARLLQIVSMANQDVRRPAGAAALSAMA
jgi:spore maturation protein CgeB